jgi:vacuolar-type H+-ATPase subunit D/Vma8
MANIPPDKRKLYNSRNQMQNTWNSFSWLLKDKVDQLDHLMFKMYQESRTLGVTEEYYKEFVNTNMYHLIDSVAAEREERERQGVKGGKGR